MEERQGLTEGEGADLATAAKAAMDLAPPKASEEHQLQAPQVAEVAVVWVVVAAEEDSIQKSLPVPQEQRLGEGMAETLPPTGEKVAHTMLWRLEGRRVRSLAGLAAGTAEAVLPLLALTSEEAGAVVTTAAVEPVQAAIAGIRLVAVAVRALSLIG
jgi:hypothetical protein